jgi:hypothetical protein
MADTNNSELQAKADRIRRACKGIAITIAPNEPDRWVEIEQSLFELCSSVITYSLAPWTSSK